MKAKYYKSRYDDLSFKHFIMWLLLTTKNTFHYQ